MAALATPSARSQEGPRAEGIPRLRFEYRCYVEESGWSDRTDVQRMFREKLEAQIPLHRAGSAELAAVEEILGRALWAAAQALEKKGDLRGAQPYAARIGRLKGAPESIRAEASDLNDRVSVEDMEVARKGGQWDRVRELAEGLLTSRKVPIVEKALGSLRDSLVEAEGLAAVAGKDLAREGVALEKILGAYDGAVARAYGGTVPAAVRAAVDSAAKRDRDRLRTIEDSTGWVNFEVLACGAKFGPAFKGAVATVDPATVTLSLQPEKGSTGEPWSRAGVLPGKQLFLRGTYDIDATLPGGTRPFARWLRVTVDKEAKTLRVPDRAPEGMVYVGPWTAADGKHGGFFGDLLEVTAASVRQFGAGVDGVKDIVGDQAGGDTAPAWFPEDDQGGGHSIPFAAAVGKAVPTAAQWLDLCFGPYTAAERAFPWGPGPVDPARHAVVGRSSDKGLAVGTLAAGASPYGALDMCGGMAELVRFNDGLWALGGCWKNAPEDFAVAAQNPLRDPAPGFPAYTALPDTAPAGRPSKNAYSTYKAPYADVYTTGVRLVVVIEP